MSKFIPVPSHIQSEDDLKHLFKPLLDVLDSNQTMRAEKDIIGHATKSNKPSQDIDHEEELQQQIVQTGSKVKIFWSKEELQDTDWNSGWYSATVHSYDTDTDLLTITSSSERGIPYEEELFPLITNKKIKVQWSPL